MRCSHCGRDMSRHTTHVAYQLPDCVWAIPKQERERRALFTPDLCCLDAERHFIRAVVLVPLPGGVEPFGWGLWAEVSKDVYERYVALYDRDAEGEPPAEGTIANQPPGYPPVVGHPVVVRFGSASKRPTLELHPSDHPLYREQAEGITANRLHEILQACKPSR